jgi:hypothetical protein
MSRLLLAGPDRRSLRLLGVLAVAVACAASLIASSVESPAAVGARAESQRMGRSPADLRAARARAIAAAHSLTASHPKQQPPPHEPPIARERTADSIHAAALFAARSWYVAPPPPPPAAPLPPPPPEAPPFPYAFVGSYAPTGEQPVYFLAKADRVIDAHVGDRLDGIYAFESADSGNLVFNYLPLNIRQSVPTGASP